MALVLQSAPERRSDARLVFARGGGTTILLRQQVPYPFHITKPFRLHPGRPDLVTLYLQSASGGIYGGDHLTLALEARSGAHAYVTTQSGTVVHRASANTSRQETDLSVAADAFLALNPDPLILFPDACLSVKTDVTVAQGARALLTESFVHHDPLGQDRPFDRIDLDFRVRTPTGEILVHDRGRIDGRAFLSPVSPLGGHRAYGATGASALPNGAGLGLPILAPDGGRLAAGLDDVFRLAFESLTDCEAARRRK